MRISRHLGIYAKRKRADTSETLTPTASRAYANTSTSSGIDGRVGRASGYSYAWNMRYTFKPTKNHSSLQVTVAYTTLYGTVDAYFRMAVTTSTSGSYPTSYVQPTHNATAKTFTATITGNFVAGTTYYLRFWKTTSGNYVYCDGAKKENVTIVGD